MKLPRWVEETSSLVRPDAVDWNLIIAELAELATIAGEQQSVVGHPLGL